MSNAIGLFVGAAVFAAGSAFGWWMHPSGSTAPVTAERADDASGLVRAMAELRAALRDASVELTAPRGAPEPHEAQGRAPAARVAGIDAEELLRRLDERLARAESAIATPRAHAVEAPTGRVLEDAARLATLDDLATFRREQELLSERENSTDAMVDFQSRLRAVYLFQTLDQVLARHGKPTQVEGGKGTLWLRYRLERAGAEPQELALAIVEGRVVEVDFQ